MKELGDGTCGTVYKAINMRTSEIVAVKKMKRKFYDWVECINLREVKSLCKLNHPNIIKLKEIVRENNELFFIFEYMEHNLYQTMKEWQRPLSEEEIRGLLSQLLQGLAHIHRNGYFHRDLKPGIMYFKCLCIRCSSILFAKLLSQVIIFLSASREFTCDQ
nr:serine/threonine-protein kinase MHK-like isoform X1 [Ipomoea batatas]